MKRDNKIALWTALIVGLGGSFLLVNSKALTPVANLEAENGTVSSSACTSSDASASGSWAVKFGCVTQAPGTNDEIHWTITGANSVSLDWRGSNSDIRYGTTTSYGSTAIAYTPNPVPISSPGPFWEVRLTSLSPATTYHYSIGSGVDRIFKTAPARGSSGFTVVAEGDIGDKNTYTNVGIVQNMIGALNPNIVLGIGDLTYGNAHGQSAVDQHFNDVMAWSGGATAYEPAWGNHEWDSPTADDLRNYKGRFDFANPQTSPGEPAVGGVGEDWDWFDYGNVRFISFPEPWSGAWSDWKTKATTIMDQAQADSQIRYIITYGHRPSYSSGHHPGDSTLAGYMGTLGAAHSKYVLNLNGHSHNYERTSPQSGVTHITAGIGGSSLEEDGSCLWLTCTQPSWSAVRYMHLGVLKLDISSTGITGSYICGPSGSGTNDITCSQGTVIDSFTIP